MATAPKLGYGTSLALVHSALACYYDHRDEIEAYLEESQRAAAELEAERAEYLSRHPGL
jgi:hypothetical protein